MRLQSSWRHYLALPSWAARGIPFVSSRRKDGTGRDGGGNLGQMARSDTSACPVPVLLWPALNSFKPRVYCSAGHSSTARA